MTVGRKIALSYSVLTLLSVLLGAEALRTMRGVTGQVDSMVAGSLLGMEYIGRLNGIGKGIRGSIHGHITAKSLKDKRKAAADLDRLKEDCRKYLGLYEASSRTEANRQSFGEIPPAFQRLLRTSDAIFPLSMARKPKAAMKLLRSETIPAYNAVDALVEQEITRNVAEGHRTAGRVREAAARSRQRILGCLAGALLLGGVLGSLVIRGINRALRRSVTRLRGVAGEVHGAAREIAAAGQSLAKSAAEQTLTLEQTVAAAGEISSMSKGNAAGTEAARKGMTDVDDRLREADRFVSQMVQSMTAMTESSEKISRIIKVIDEIAFQTNLLALNAAVEAARAGKAGLGFAVVAEEVRNLAQRSAEAAHGTAELIEESIRRSKEGAARLGKVTGAMKEITGSGARVKDLVARTSLGAQQSLDGLEQIARSTSKLSTMTRQVAAGAGQTAAAATQVEEQAEKLRHVVTELESIAGTRQRA